MLVYNMNNECYLHNKYITNLRSHSQANLRVTCEAIAVNLHTPRVLPPSFSYRLCVWIMCALLMMFESLDCYKFETFEVGTWKLLLPARVARRQRVFLDKYKNLGVISTLVTFEKHNTTTLSKSVFHCKILKFSYVLVTSCICIIHI